MKDFSLLDENLQQLSLLTEEINDTTFKSFVGSILSFDELIEWFDVNMEIGFETDNGIRVVGEPTDNLKNFNKFITDYKITSPIDSFTKKIGLSFDWTLLIAKILKLSKLGNNNNNTDNKIKNIFTILTIIEDQGIIYSNLCYEDNMDKYSFIELYDDFKGLRGGFESLAEVIANITQIVKRKYNTTKNISNIYPIKVLQPGMKLDDIANIVARFRYEIYLEKLLDRKEIDKNE